MGHAKMMRRSPRIPSTATSKKSKLESTWELWAHEKGGMTLHIVANSSRANQMDPVIGPTE